MSATVGVAPPPRGRLSPSGWAALIARSCRRSSLDPAEDRAREQPHREHHPAQRPRRPDGVRATVEPRQRPRPRPPAACTPAAPARDRGSCACARSRAARRARARRRPCSSSPSACASESRPAFDAPYTAFARRGRSAATDDSTTIVPQPRSRIRRAVCSSSDPAPTRLTRITCAPPRRRRSADPPRSPSSPTATIARSTPPSRSNACSSTAA